VTRSAAALSVRDLAVAPEARAEPVLHGVTFDIAPGECVALVGPSGAGKTTLLRTIALDLPPRAGRMLIAGADVAGVRGGALRRLRSGIGMITQKHDLVEPLRVDKNVMAGALGRWSTWHALRFLCWATSGELAEASEALAAVGLADKLKRPTTALSGGEQQRVAIARALVQAPGLLLADEPVASLDRVTTQQVLGLLTGLARSRRMALVVSLHQADLAERFCDAIITVGAGTTTRN